MKKFFMFAAMASVALASCVKNEPVANVEQGDLITFNSPVVAPATKATNNENAIAFPHADFSAYAWYAEKDVYDGADASLYFANRTFADKVTYWGSNPASFWPKNGKLTFVAYAPVTNGPSVVTADNATDSKTLTVSYTVQDAIASQVDVLYSDWVANKTSTSDTYETANKYADTGIDLPFHHALSAVKFQIKAKSADVAPYLKIKNITLSGVKNSGNLTIPFGAAAYWSTGSGDASYTVLTSADAAASKAFTGTNVINLNDGTQFILYPQTLNAELTVVYYMKTDGDWLEQTLPVELTDTWEMGRRYTYTLIFDLDEIKLAPVVAEEWADESGVDVNAKL